MRGINLYLYTIQLSDDFWMSLTLDGILNSITTFATVIGAFLIAYLTSVNKKKLQDEGIKEESKKIYLRYKIAFKKISGVSRLILKGGNTKGSDIKLSIRELKLQLEKINETDILSIAPSKVYMDLHSLLNKGWLFAHTFENIVTILDREGVEKYEEYLLDKSAKHYSEINKLIANAEKILSEIEYFSQEIIKYYE